MGSSSRAVVAPPHVQHTKRANYRTSLDQTMYQRCTYVQVVHAKHQSCFVLYSSNIPPIPVRLHSVFTHLLTETSYLVGRGGLGGEQNALCAERVRIFGVCGATARGIIIIPLWALFYTLD